MRDVFLDSCIVIDIINGKLKLEHLKTEKLIINSIVDMEVLVGARNKRDLNTINKKLSEFYIVETGQDALYLARQLINKYTLSQNMTLYDAIIAATCLIYEIPLCTYNKKDFKFIDKIELIDLANDYLFHHPS